MTKTKSKKSVKCGKCGKCEKCKKPASSPTSRFCTSCREKVLQDMRESGYLDGWDPKLAHTNSKVNVIDDKIREAFTTKVKLEEVGLVD